MTFQHIQQKQQLKKKEPETLTRQTSEINPFVHIILFLEW